ncbi:MAG TPA: BrnA antitoxin family protein [Hyphomicrobiaceae bacterium]|nr:BrnA antitoxin family protein [Hyphomicrobiaceae bacterium]
MSEKNITKRLAAEARQGKTDYDRLRRMTDRDIADAVKRDKDAARLDIDWSEAEVVFPNAKQAISIRLDKDIIEFFKRTGPGYQTKINAVLRSYVQHESHEKG